MTATVRCFVHDGMIAAHISNPSAQYSANAVWLLRQPYLARETLTANTGSPVLSGAELAESKATRLLLVQVQQGKLVHYRITPNGSAPIDATADDPILSGQETLQFNEGWRISFLEAS